jgi:hypothetical protein
LSRSIVLALLAVLVLFAASFLVLEVLPFPFGLGGDRSDEADRGPELLTQEDEDGAALVLEGRGRKQEDRQDEGLTSAAAAEAIPATVTGGTPGGAIVRGRVVLEKGGLPVGGVKVTLSRPDSLVAYLRAKANGRFDELEARTGADGRFAFLDVTPSQGYAVRAFHDGYAAASHAERLDLRGRGSTDVGDLALGMGAGIKGRVVNEEGAPLPGVRVAVTWNIQNPLGVVIVHPDTAPELERETLTDADGRYAIDKLEPGPKTVFGELEGGGAEVKARVNLKPGQTRELKDMVIPSGRFLAGVVRYKSGAPVPDARVFGAPAQESSMRATEADAEGHWRLDHLPDGKTYVLGVLVPGLPVEYVEDFELNRDDIVIEFPDPGALQGVVVRAGDGTPVTRFAVELESAEPPEDFQRQYVEQQVKRGLGPAPFQSETGSFSFPRSAPGTYVVEVHAPGFPTVRKEGVVIVAGESTEVRIELPAGNIARGRVERSGGEPVAGARLFVVPAGSVPMGGRVLSASAYTSDRDPLAASRGDGSFELPPQTPGRYDLIAEIEDELPGVLRDVDLETADVSGLTLRLPPSGRVAGRIVKEEGGPAAGEEIYVLYPDGVVRTFFADEEGRFAQGGLPVGRCLVRWVSLNDTKDYLAFMRERSEEAVGRGYDRLRQKGQEHVISDGLTTQVMLRLPARTQVRGRFRIAGEVPPEGKRTFYVTVEGGGRWVSVNVEADTGGEFSLPLQPGSYLAYAPSSGDEFRVVPFVVTERAVQTFDLDTD